MPLLQRTSNLSSFLSWPGLRAAFGLLSSDARRTWIQTVNAPRLSMAPLGMIYPWFSFPSIEYIARISSPDMRVLEFGCGYSTIWWAQRVSRVTSIERSSHWIAEVRHALSKHTMANVDVIPFLEFTGATEEEIQMRADPIQLASIIQRYASAGQENSELYDVVVIDDVFRNEAATAAIAKLKPGGILVFDDSERPRYNQTGELFKQMGWSFASFYGATPYHFHEKQTTVWHKPIHE